MKKGIQLALVIPALFLCEEQSSLAVRCQGLDAMRRSGLQNLSPRIQKMREMEQEIDEYLKNNPSCKNLMKDAAASASAATGASLVGIRETAQLYTSQEDEVIQCRDGLRLLLTKAMSFSDSQLIPLTLSNLTDLGELKNEEQRISGECKPILIDMENLNKQALQFLKASTDLLSQKAADLENYGKTRLAFAEMAKLSSARVGDDFKTPLSGPMVKSKQQSSEITSKRMPSSTKGNSTITGSIKDEPLPTK